jgi:hypothetical protein
MLRDRSGRRFEVGTAFGNCAGAGVNEVCCGDADWEGMVEYSPFERWAWVHDGIKVPESH